MPPPVGTEHNKKKHTWVKTKELPKRLETKQKKNIENTENTESMK